MENGGDFFSRLGYEGKNLTDSEKVDILRQILDTYPGIMIWKTN